MAHFIGGQWIGGVGEPFRSIDPSTGETVWSGPSATAVEVEAAVAAARTAASDWAALSVAERYAHLDRFAALFRADRVDLAERIAREIGKPLWESLTEIDAMIGKAAITLDALQKRRPDESASPVGAATRYKPHGVLAVFGPFNFPGHLPNGHIMPALLAGNTVVFKPSEHAPAFAQRTVEIWHAAGLPGGVINLVQGGRDTGIALSKQPGIDGLLFTGSVAAGRALSRVFGGFPEKILALELGGNAPLVLHASADADAAAYLAVQSAFVTSGQRCSCARRLIVPSGAGGDRVITRLVEISRGVRVGRYSDAPEPFMGPLISEAAAEGVLRTQADLVRRGGTALLTAATVGGCRAMLSPGIIDVTGITVPDEETFGPLLQVIRVPDFDAAIAEAGRTAFGLAAGLLGGTRADYERFRQSVRAGVVNWNCPTTAASGALPFGGVGLSGNHRPSAYFAIDYCSYAVASLEGETLQMPTTLMPGLAPSPGTSG